MYKKCNNLTGRNSVGMVSSDGGIERDFISMDFHDEKTQQQESVKAWFSLARQAQAQA